jgi:adenylate cyclase
VAVLFADIVGFTTYCDQYEQAPEEVVKHLRGLVEVWDDIAQLHGVQKIKTIGDAFMAAGGLLTKLTSPVMSCVVCGLQMVTATRKLPIGWNLRVGIHVGPVVAGVLGRRQNLFDLWGDTVNIAARMESNALPGGIALSKEAWQQVAPRCRPVTPRQVQIKGKHLMDVYDFGGFLAEQGNQKLTPFPNLF